MMVPGRRGRLRAKAEAFDLDQREFQMVLNVLRMAARSRMRFFLVLLCNCVRANAVVLFAALVVL